jgi:hypothetical protein
MIMLLVSIFQSVKVSFQTKPSTNKLTIYTYYLVSVLLFCELVQYSCTLAMGTRSVTFWNQFSNLLIS